MDQNAGVTRRRRGAASRTAGGAPVAATAPVAAANTTSGTASAVRLRKGVGSGTRDKPRRPGTQGRRER